MKFNAKEGLEDIIQQISTFNFNVSQEPIKKEISEKTKEETRKALKGKILEKVNNDAISHSKSTGLKCLVSKVNFSSNRYDYSVSNKKTGEKESQTSNIGTANDIVEIIVDAKVTFSCDKAKKNVNKKAKKKKSKKKNTNKKKNHHKKADTIVKSYEISKVSR